MKHDFSEVDIDNAYAEGRSDGYALGYAEGRSDGYALGYDDGYDEGYSLGYDEGYSGVKTLIKMSTT